MSKNRILSKAIVDAIIRDLEDRSGLQNVWEEIVMECLS